MKLRLGIEVDDLDTANTILAALNGFFGLTSVGIYVDDATVVNDDGTEVNLVVEGEPIEA